MLSKTFQLMAKDFNLKADENTAYGIYGGYMITVYEIKNRKTVFFNCAFPSEDDALGEYDLSETVQKVIDKYAITDYDFSSSGVTFVSKGDIAQFAELIKWGAALLTECKVSGADVCSVCGESLKAKSTKRVCDGLNNYLCCESCALDMLDSEDNQEKAEKDLPKNTAKSVIFSILFGLLGLLVFVGAYFIIPVAKDGKAPSMNFCYIVGILGFLIAFLTVFGYKRFTKQKSVSSIVTVCVITLVIVLLAQIIGSVIFYYRESGRELFTRLDLILRMHFAVPEYLAKMGGYAVVDLLFAGIGLVVFLFDIFSSGKENEKKNYTVTKYVR